jgi:putative membrane protein
VWYMHDVGWGWWVLMSLGMVAFWSLVVYGVIWLARSTPGVPVPPPERRESPQAILERRLAAGEISLEQYERLRDALVEQPADVRGALVKDD